MTESFQLGASIISGAGLMFVSVAVLAWTWSRILAKKSIALTVLVIVIKYAVLLGSIFFLAQTEWFSVLGAGLGIAGFLLVALFYAVAYEKKHSRSS